jgi:predicted nucleotidyltransferase
VPESDFSLVPPALLTGLGGVVRNVLSAAPALLSEDVMVIGAWCRDILHVASGHSFPIAATLDLDLALALASWDAYKALVKTLPLVGDSGIRFQIMDQQVDLIPFGTVEDPPGIALPPERTESLGVWALKQVHAAAQPLSVGDGLIVKIPTIAGFAATKIGAWLDRSAWGETKDARDLATVLFWYDQDPHTSWRLYETVQGNAILADQNFDLGLASAQLLGHDVAHLVGPQLAAEVLNKLSQSAGALAIHLQTVRFSQPQTRRQSLVAAIIKGMGG